MHLLDPLPIKPDYLGMMLLDLADYVLTNSPPRAWIGNSEQVGSRDWLVPIIVTGHRMTGRPLTVHVRKARRADLAREVHTAATATFSTGTWSDPSSRAARGTLADFMSKNTPPFSRSAATVARSGRLPYPGAELARVAACRSRGF